ncbi:hypothetical protein BJX70DRAFT_360940 [Aspergillus crustosus]
MWCVLLASGKCLNRRLGTSRELADTASRMERCNPRLSVLGFPKQMLLWGWCLVFFVLFFHLQKSRSRCLRRTRVLAGMGQGSVPLRLLLDLVSHQSWRICKWIHWFPTLGISLWCADRLLPQSLQCMMGLGFFSFRERTTTDDSWITYCDQYTSNTGLDPSSSSHRLDRACSISPQRDPAPACKVENRTFVFPVTIP